MEELEEVYSGWWGDERGRVIVDVPFDVRKAHDVKTFNEKIADVRPRSGS